MIDKTVTQGLFDSTRNKVLGLLSVGLFALLIAGPYLPNLPVINQSFLFYLMFWTGLALSINMIFGFTGYIPFGFFAFYGIGSYGFGLSYLHLNAPLPVAVLFGGLAGLLLGLVFLPMFKLDGIYFAIANFAGAYAVRIGIELTPRDLTGGATGIQLAAVYSPLQSYYAILLSFVGVILVTLYLLRSRFGIILKAIRDNPVAAESSGINRARGRAYAWLLSTIFAGFFGAIDAWNTAIVDPRSAFNILLSVKPLLYAIFGGPATLLGPVIGSFSLYSLDTLIWQALPLGSYFLTGLVLMIVVLLLPRGILGELEDKQLSFNVMLIKFTKLWNKVVN